MGEFQVFPARGPGTVSTDRWFTLFAHNTGSGIIDFVEVINQPSAGPLGDFNNNGMRDVEDLDILADAQQNGGDLGTFDLNTDGNIDENDRKYWLNDLSNTFVGDSNFDGEFGSGDFVVAFQAGKYESGQPATWDGRRLEW